MTQLEAAKEEVRAAFLEWCTLQNAEAAQS